MKNSIAFLLLVFFASYGSFLRFHYYNLPADYDGNLCAAPADMDRDGFDDIITGIVGGMPRVYHNTGVDSDHDGFINFVMENWRIDTAFSDPNIINPAIGFFDANCDSFPDIFCGMCRNWGHGGAQNIILINNGLGEFSHSANNIPIRNDRTMAVKICDLNNDGLKDIIVGNGAVSGSTVFYDRSYVLLNSGILNDDSLYIFFDPFDSLELRDSVWSDSFCTYDVVIADFDGNGFEDIILINRHQSCKLFLNVCAHSGAVPHFIDVTTRLPDTLKRPLDFICGAAADFDNDGDKDLIISAFQAPCLYFINDGTANFRLSSFPPNVNGFRRKIKVADVNNDSLPDIITGDQTVQIFLNTPASPGNFVNISTDSVQFNPGSEHYTVHGLAISDFDGNGFVDIFCADYFEQNRIYFNEGGHFLFGTFTHYPADAKDDYQIYPYDIDGDGDLDIFFGGVADSIHFYENIANTTFVSKNYRINNQSWATYHRGGGSIQSKMRAIVFGDFDHNGSTDFIIGGFDAYNPVINIHIYINNGSGWFKDSTRANIPWLTGHQVKDMFLINANGDSLLDLFIAGSDVIYINNGDIDGDGVDNFVFLRRALPTLAGISGWCDCADINSDGFDDILISKTGLFGMQNKLFLANGDGTYRDATDSLFPHSALINDATSAARFGYANNDSFLDILFVNSSQQNRLLIFNPLINKFIDATDSLPSDSFFPDNDARFADINGDSAQDIVIVVHDNRVTFASIYRHPRVYINNGNGHFFDSTSAYIPSIGTLHENQWSINVGDLDGDGDPDFITQTDGQSRIWWNDYADLTSVDREMLQSKSPRINIFPNPFNSFCIIRFDNSRKPVDKIIIFDIKGRKVFEKNIRKDQKFLIWQPDERLSSGIYLTLMISEKHFIKIKKMIYIK